MSDCRCVSLIFHHWVTLQAHGTAFTSMYNMQRRSVCRLYFGWDTFKGRGGGAQRLKKPSNAGCLRSAQPRLWLKMLMFLFCALMWDEQWRRRWWGGVTVRRCNPLFVAMHWHPAERCDSPNQSCHRESPWVRQLTTPLTHTPPPRHSSTSKAAQL